jgi:hypothetical protein
MKTGYAVYSNEFGVFLGHMMGDSFWSGIDPVGQSEAIAFEYEALANQVMMETGLKPSTYKLIPVEITSRREKVNFASMEACMKAGIPAWSPDGEPIIGILINPTKQITLNLSKDTLRNITYNGSILQWSEGLLDYMEEVEIMAVRTVNKAEAYVIRKDGKHYLAETDGVLVKAMELKSI